jgi:hypothetical protein
MTLAIFVGAAILVSTGYILQRQSIDTLQFRVGRIRLIQGQRPSIEK